MKYSSPSCKFAWHILLFISLTIPFLSQAQIDGVPPAGESCVISVGNINAPVAADGSFQLFSVPVTGIIRGRAACTDGTVGQTDFALTVPIDGTKIPMSPIKFGELDPVPNVLILESDSRRLTIGGTAQLTATAFDVNGAPSDVSSIADGTLYAASNPLLGNITTNGQVNVTANFSPTSSARLLATATNQGSLSSTVNLFLGPQGTLTGTVYRADGTTPVANAQVAITRLQPQESAGTGITDNDGVFAFGEVTAGSFRISAIDPVNGDQATANATIDSEGQVVDVDLVMNGLGQVNVQLVDISGDPVVSAGVTLSTLGEFFNVETLSTNDQGEVSFAAVFAGPFSVSTRDPLTGLLGTARGTVNPQEQVDITLTLQAAGSIAGQVFDVGGIDPLEAVQVRLISRQQGIISQTISQVDGSFVFDDVPKSDGPFILDAYIDGRLRARVPNVIFVPNEDLLTQDIVLNAVGVVSGFVKDNQNNFYAGAEVSLQSLSQPAINFTAAADPAGFYVLPGVPAGDFELTATTEEGRTGIATGTITTDAEALNLDITLVTNNLVGTVYQRDGVTPVAAGTLVYLAPVRFGSVYSYADNPNATSTTTDASGRYGFQITTADDYYIQAEAGLDRGRSRSVVVNLNPSQPLVSDVVFLAKGRVTGQVRDAGGNVVAGALVGITSAGAFDAYRQTATNSSGNYSIDGIFVGNITVVALDTDTQTSGISYERLNSDGEQVVVDVTLAASGTVEGRILNNNGSVVNEPIKLTVYSNLYEFTELTIPDGSFYQVDLIPLGDVRVLAEVLSSGDKGSKTTRLDFLNEVKTLDVNLVGQGEIRVQLSDENGDDVVDATVTVRTGIPFNTTQEVMSDANGLAAFDRVFAGDYLITANKVQSFGSLEGSAGGTLLPGAVETVEITMDSIAVGSVNGTVYLSDGVTPVNAGWVVKMLPEPFSDAYVTTTDGSGNYVFPEVNEGIYNITVMGFYGQQSCPTRDRVRGATPGVAIDFQGQETTADIQLIGQGQVFGQVLDPDLNPAANIQISLTNADPVFGANQGCEGVRSDYVTYTDANGQYLLDDVPPGIFNIRAEDSINNMSAESNGIIRFDTDQAEVDMTLIDNVVAMPFNFYDANGFLYDLNGNGAIGSGTSGVFGFTPPNTTAMGLEILYNSAPFPFTNGDGSIGQLRADQQQIELDEVMNFGLVVNRKVFVPRSGYFARYLEVLSNPTDDPITVGLRLTSFHREDNSNPRVVDSSDGDQVLSVVSANPDRWVVVDDQDDNDPFESSSVPATGHVFDGNQGAVSVASAQYDLVGQVGRLRYQWDDITVNPGEQVILMHFVLNQTSRSATRIAADRLMSLPPEAIEDLNSAEKESIVNFQIPEASSAPPLPNLASGQIAGSVYSGDGITTVPGVVVRYQSLNPLFARIRETESDSLGSFEFNSTLDGTRDNYVIPITDYALQGYYSRTQVNTPIANGGFEEGLTRSEQDLVFAGLGDIRGSVLRHNDALVAGASLKLCTLDDRVDCTDELPRPANSTTSAANGSYELLANNSRIYFVFANKNHPQGVFGRGIQGRAEVTVTENDVQLLDVVMEPTGSVAGFVRLSDGTPVPDAEVELRFFDRDLPYIGRKTTSDTSGFYRFFDVPVDNYSLRAEDPASGAIGNDSADVTVDQETNQDIELGTSALVNVTIEYERGLPANNALLTANISGQGFSGFSDSNGLVQLQVPTGTFRLTARHPDKTDNLTSSLRTSVDVTVTESDDVIDVTIVLPPAGEVFGSITRPDNTTPAGGFPYVIKQISGPSIRDIRRQTDALGDYRVAGLPPGNYVITAYDEAQDRFADAEFLISSDGEELPLDLLLLDERIQLPADLFDANRFLYDVQLNGSLDTGEGAFLGASTLSIDGVEFVGDTSAKLEAGRKQFAVTQDNPISGLEVTRKIYVPRGAYFARYLEVIENPTAADIVVDISVNSQYEDGAVIATADGDSVLTTSDQWLIIDDSFDEDRALNGNQTPVNAHITYGDGAEIITSEVNLIDNNGNPQIEHRWNQTTIPAGDRITLMHVWVQQINRAGAQFAAARLVDQPSELLADLTTAELLTIKNFNVPVDGVSQLPALPPLTGQVNGLVLEGNLSTVVVDAPINVQSSHPLFNRIWGVNGLCASDDTVVDTLTSAADGSYSLTAQLTDIDSIAIPQGFDLRVAAQEDINCSYAFDAGHPVTGVPSRVATIEASGSQDVIFDTAVITGTATGSIDYSITDGYVYRSIDNRYGPGQRYVDIQSDGSYVLPGVPSGTVDILFDTNHPDSKAFGDDILRGENPGIQAIAGEVLVVDIQMQPTGVLRGVVSRFDGAPSTTAELELVGLPENQNYDQCATGCLPEAIPLNTGKRMVSRIVTSDGLGRYDFGAVPDGSYELIATDSEVGGTVSIPVVINENQTTNQDVTLNATSNLRVVVVDEDNGNSALFNARLALIDLNDDSIREFVNTDSQGYALFDNLPPSTYQVHVEFNNAYEQTFTVEIVAGQNGQLIEQVIGFATSKHRTGNFNYGAASQLYQVAVETDDQLSLSIRSNNNCSFLVTAYDENDNYLGYGRGNTTNQTNTDGRIDLLNVSGTGFYTVALSANNTSCFSGTYTLAASLNGLSTDLVALQQAGTVTGTVLDSDGSTPVTNSFIRLETLDGQPVYRQQVLTDANGQYLFENVPIGNFRVTYVPVSSVNETGVIATDGEVVNIDLSLLISTNMNIRVLNDDLTPINTSVRLDIRALGQSTQRPFTNSQGEYAYVYNGVETVSIRVTSPSNSQIKAIQFVEPTGGSVDVDLILDSAVIGGVVYEADGTTPVANSRVTVYYSTDNGYVTQTNSDGTGNYQFDNLPVNVELSLLATDPTNQVQTLVAVTSVAGPGLVQDIILSGKGSVFGQVTGFGGITAPNMDMNVSFVVNPVNGNTNGSFTSTDSDGNFMFNDLPTGQQISVRYDTYRSYAYMYGTADVTINNQGDSEEVNFSVPGSSISISLSAADTQPLGGNCVIILTTEIYDSGDGGPEWFSDEMSCDAPLNVIGIPPGQTVSLRIFTADNYESLYQNSWNILTDQLIQESVELSVVTGKVTFFDGSPVASARIGTNGGNGAVADANGDYRMLGVKQGPFTATARDNNTGITGTADGVMLNENIPQTLDIQLQAAGTINGNVYASDGSPMPSITVYALSSNARFNSQDQTDATGFYEIEHVIVGDVEVSTVDFNTQNVVDDLVTLANDGEVQSVDLNFAVPGSITGILDDLNGDPVDSGCVELNHVKSAQAYNSVFYSTSTDSNGVYMFDSVAPGELLIHGSEGSCYDSSPSGLLTDTVVADTQNSTDLQTGNAMPLSNSLNNGGLKFRLDVSQSGAINPRNNTRIGLASNQPFTSSLYATINNQNLNEQNAVSEKALDQQILFGPTDTFTWRYHRDIYMGSDGDFARVSEVVENTSLTAKTVTVKYTGRYGNSELDFNGIDSSSGILLDTDPASNGNRFAVHDYTGSDSTNPAVVGYVFSGNNVLIPVTVDFAAAQAGFSWSWEQLVQPGERVIFISYLAFDEPGNNAAVNTTINELLNGTKVGMFEGLTTDELADVVNFEVP